MKLDVRAKKIMTNYLLQNNANFITIGRKGFPRKYLTCAANLIRLLFIRSYVSSLGERKAEGISIYLEFSVEEIQRKRIMEDKKREIVLLYAQIEAKC
jgi:hypothetical protein